ncbi:type VI secretion system accessory protein TagJ [Agrobacterium rubi]|uniref:Nitrogen fixation protein n=2 Tax=Agrobacterium rubi TaxID=28099 RepID=A0AAE7R6I0_9HYPH|nr:type VI secretion system accessory protein TagJ [Agrobacterium rubi]MBP1878645.1 type VI secretion system protein ImpE [Agrobacterium rubi]MCL6652994.1 nitrogen fixation protein [Agrobacterium rubi]NTE88732.1 nitrogen fixation protein [Agrobacterium rubi]NTF04560.1 nitrogen fixation protein [Agrobacterium rubi]NTF10092.1 nitrogen fixation protein [Agrobacterium rubi]
MTLRDDISRLLDGDQLQDAIAAAKEHVKVKPSDKEGRNLYVDLLILAGEFEKADAQCNLAATFAPQDAVGFSIIRQHLRAMAARNAWFENGAVPDFANGPSELDQLAIKANIATRAGDTEGATSALAELEAQRGELSIACNDKPAGDIRDLDDRIPHALEVLTDGGRYLWIDYNRIESLTVEPMKRPRDIAFRQAELSLRDGAMASVLLPSIYHGDTDSAPMLLGRETIWNDDGPLVTGQGQRCLLIGNDLVPFHEISTLSAPAETNERQTARG